MGPAGCTQPSEGPTLQSVVFKHLFTGFFMSILKGQSRWGSTYYTAVIIPTVLTQSTWNRVRKGITYCRLSSEGRSTVLDLFRGYPGSNPVAVGLSCQESMEQKSASMLAKICLKQSVLERALS